MSRSPLHRFEHDGKRFAIDPETCFCFECDEICWDVLEHYAQETSNRIFHLLEEKYSLKELEEVAGELEWLRASKSILRAPKKEDLLKQFEVERGLKRVSVVLPRETDGLVPAQGRWFGRGARVAPPGGREVCRGAVLLLLGRSGMQKELHLELVEEGRIHSPELIAELCEWALKSARLAEKTLTVSVHVANISLAKLPESLAGHALGAKLELKSGEGVLAHVKGLAAGVGETLPRLAKALEPNSKDAGGRIVVRPNHPGFGKVAETLDEAGFTGIEIDLDGAYAANPGLEPGAVTAAMEENARYYAGRLLKHHYFRLDPIAPLFWRIYSGAPVARSDFAGTNEMSVACDGKIYPSMRLAGEESFCLGSLADGLDEEKVRPFEDVGSLTTYPCTGCWARNLCGGGTAAVHHALTGSMRTPHPAWCDGQRAWVQSAVSAFQTLSSAGIHFERVYKILGRREKPSLFALAKAAITMSIGVRPIEEADAELITRWENWNESAYFLFNESGVYLATKYDREMDSLHPRGIDQELMLLRKSGEPFGLLKLRPKWVGGAVTVWLYMRDEADYEADAIRKSFRAILKEAAGQSTVRQIVVPVSAKEKPLRDFLVAIGFQPLGILREALYLHGSYHDVSLYAISPEKL
ncbi:MAG: GNAT family N-acetyltransferase [Candidatus Hydrogenedentes bacterium]|nr:GNAT family N-acetyltransferase [Candidatus Hydrogenedentota bacterium]